MAAAELDMAYPEGIHQEGRSKLDWHAYQEANSVIYVHPGSLFEAGSHSIRWDGTDVNGNAVSPSARYRYFIAGLHDWGHSRLIGERVRVHLHADHLDVYYAQRYLERMELGKVAISDS